MQTLSVTLLKDVHKMNNYFKTFIFRPISYLHTMTSSAYPKYPLAKFR